MDAPATDSRVEETIDAFDRVAATVGQEAAHAIYNLIKACIRDRFDDVAEMIEEMNRG